LPTPTCSDGHGLAWPESQGLGSAKGGSGLVEIQARPWALALAGSKPGPAQARACSVRVLRDEPRPKRV